MTVGVFRTIGTDVFIREPLTGLSPGELFTIREIDSSKRQQFS